MWTLDRYTEWIMERLSALGALPEDIENVVRSAQQEVLTRLSQRTGIPLNRGMQLSLFDPAMLHQEIEVHKRTRIRELMQIVTVRQTDRSTPNSFTRAVESLIPEADFGSGRIFEIPEPVRRVFGLNIQVDERSILSAFINGFRTGLIRSLGTIHEPSITNAFNQRELNGLGIAIGVIWGASDEIIDTVDSAARFSRNIWEIITEGIPQEVIQAIRIISERLSQGISDQELIDLAAQAGDQTGESAASDFVNNVTLVYRMSPSDPLLSNVWPSIVTGRLIMPLVRTLLELVLAWTPAGGGLLIIRIAARIMRYMPDISGPLQRLA
ncbi:MAG: hypothetical protein GX660_29185, partial [Clostridiaceae bacterium]|nr:hypothetical protein [Clostridiaceae bacterium]